MFTGLVEETGRIESVEPRTEGICLRVHATTSAEGLARGDSIAISGVCQTVIETDGSSSFAVIAIGETLRRTNFSTLRVGSAVNLERPLRLGDRLGGHMVQGHVDGVGRISEIRARGNDHAVEIALPRTLAPYVVEKGSIAIDGVSLTVGPVRDRGDTTFLWVYIIPETLERTLFGSYQPGALVNVEVDILAKYVLRSAVRNESPAPAEG